MNSLSTSVRRETTLRPNPSSCHTVKETEVAFLKPRRPRGGGGVRVTSPLAAHLTGVVDAASRDGDVHSVMTGTIVVSVNSILTVSYYALTQVECK